jgi:predicted HicB family RNase H-like nuclease
MGYTNLMEQRAKYKELHLRIDPELHQWLKDRAKAQRRSLNAEAEMAFEAWRYSVEISVSDVERLLTSR